ncbi:TerB family tellurite resistance protein [Sphingobacterium sp. PCS056]|uniref:TerB family tellurite resistance protein n=1 Tax=Sphingobacterium sp. PCS056 TaxID=2931400 RepID=UPI00200D6B58|nr:TerB family tellurite resistance protein [Sphingobacterium sp. PCS056]UPZ36479.1 TerB family tellurite resistance protein [Sphingobacterium sp. PCS056]
MKKILVVLFLISIGITSTQGQVQESMQLALNIEKLAQFKQILSNMKKGYEALSGGYNTIKGISQGNFKLHQAFLDGLMQVSPTVRNYRKVGEIVNYQVTLVNEYRGAYERFRSDQNFTANEIEYLATVYNNLLKESIMNLDELTNIITSGKMRMSDDERLKAIDGIYNEMEQKILFLRHFNNKTGVMALQRAKERKDAQTIARIYGINH